MSQTNDAKKKQKEIESICCALITIEDSDLFKGIMLHVPRRYTPNLETAIMTDGKILRIGDKWFELEMTQRFHVLLKGLMHVALQHQQRSAELRHDPIAQKIWSLSAQVIADEIIPIGGRYFNAPANTVYIKDIRPYLKDEAKANEYTAEQIFRDLYHKVTQDGLLADPKFAKILENLEDTLATEPFPESKDIMDQMNSFFSEYSDQPNIMKEMWDKLIRNSFAGKTTSKEMLKLLSQIPKPKVPWKTLLKRYLNARLRPDREINWKRPARQFISGDRQFFIPSWAKKKGIRRLVLLLDVSGSCFDSNTFTEFISNIESIQKATNSEIILLSFDYEVTGTHMIPADQSLLKLINSGAVNIKGGGGTSFVHCMQEALAHMPDVIVCLTDGYGKFPDDKPSIPVIWALVNSNVEVPWGQSINIDE